MNSLLGKEKLEIEITRDGSGGIGRVSGASARWRREAAQGSRPMQRWYQPCMQAPKQRKEAEESLSVCGGEEGEAEIVWVPTIHEGAELVFAARRRKRSGLPAAREEG